MVEGEYQILADGWIKIERSDYSVGARHVPSGRMLLGLNQLLLKKENKLILIDTGLGDKRTPNELSLLDCQYPRKLRSELARLNIRPIDIDIVIFTHLHYDHSGGGTCRMGDLIAPTFPRAVYYVNDTELKFAMNQPPEGSSDYYPDDFIPLLEGNRLKLVKGEYEIVKGVTLHPAFGHSQGHQVVRIDLEDETLLFAGDLISTRSHANLRLTMTYDNDRTILLDNRRRWIENAKTGNWKVVFCHAIRNPVGLIDG